MIHLDVDLLFLTEHFDVGTKRLQDYGNKSIDEIMELEAANGNSKAANFDMSILTDPKKLVKLLKLFKPKNRYLILRQMSEEDLKYVMQFLEHKDLVMGLNFFSRDKLLSLIEEMPKDKIAAIMFNKFSPQKFLGLIPERELDFFFESDKLDKSQVLKFLQQLPPESLQGLMENITGQPADKENKDNIIQTVAGLNDNKFKRSLQSMDRKSKQQLIFLLTQDDNKLFLEFSKTALMYPLKQLDKPDLIKNMAVLENDDLLKCLGELPQELMAVVATQIDPEVFAELLCDKFQDVLAEIAMS